MALRDSVWFPQSRDRATVLATVTVMVVLHHSGLLGLMNAGLLFGWVPIQLAYDVVYLLLGIGILYWIATMVPDGPEEQPSTIPDESSSTEATDTTEG